MVVVGGGPIGLETAVALKRSSIDAVVLEAGSMGNTIAWWAPQTRWFSSNERIAIGGVPLMTNDGGKSDRETYLTYLRTVARQFDLDVRTQTRVTDVVDVIAKDDGGGANCEASGNGGLRVHHQGGEPIAASAVVLAVGGTDHPNRLGVPGEDLPHVDGYLREVHRYFGRRVVVVGGRNSAIEAALRLHHVGAKVSLVYRGGGLPEDHIKYWLLPEVRGLIGAGAIDAHFNSNVRQITAESVLINKGDQTVDLPCDDVLTLIGYRQDKTLFEKLGVELEGPMRRPVYDDATMQTGRRGIYVAGTATAGTQNSRYKTFLENCHQHVDKIVADIRRRMDARSNRHVARNDSRGDTRVDSSGDTCGQSGVDARSTVSMGDRMTGALGRMIETAPES